MLHNLSTLLLGIVDTYLLPIINLHINTKNLTHFDFRYFTLLQILYLI